MFGSLLSGVGKIFGLPGSSFGGALDNVTNFAIDQMRINKQNNHQKDMLKMEQEFQEKMVKNKYQNEVQSMLEAGINPATINGTSAVPSAVSAPGVSSPSKSDISSQHALMAEQLNNVQKDTEQKEANIDLTRATAEKERELARKERINADNWVSWQSNYYGSFAEQAKYYNSLSQVNQQKFDMLLQFYQLGGVKKYLRRMETQIGLDQAMTYKANEEGAVVRYKAYSERINANAHMSSAQAQHKLAENQATYNEIYRGLAKEMGNNQAKQAMYWGARAAGAKSEAELLKIREQVEKLKGVDWIATTEMAGTYISLGKQGADMVSSMLEVGEQGLDMMLNFAPGGRGVKLLKSFGSLIKKKP